MNIAYKMELLFSKQIKNKFKQQQQQKIGK